MSEYGLQAVGTDGSLVVGGGFENIFYAGKATFNSTIQINSYWGYVLFVCSYYAPAGAFTASEAPIIFYHCPLNGRVVQGTMIWDANVSRWLMAFYTGSTNQQASITIYCFKRAGIVTPSSAQYGMRLYTSAGKLAYDSGLAEKELKIKGIVIVANGQNGTTIPYPTAMSKPAILWRSQYLTKNSMNYQQKIGFYARFDANCITLSNGTYWDDTSGVYRYAFVQPQTPNLPCVFIDGAEYD